MGKELLVLVKNQFEDVFQGNINTKIQNNKLIIFIDDIEIEYSYDFEKQENIFNIYKNNNVYKVSNVTTLENCLNSTMEFIFTVNLIIDNIEKLSLENHINSSGFKIEKISQ